MVKTDRLEKWSVTSDPWAAPELGRVYLTGFSVAKQKLVKTSRIVSCEGRLVGTESGSVYELGRISSGYRKFLRENGIAYNKSQPIKVHKSPRVAAGG